MMGRMLFWLLTGAMLLVYGYLIFLIEPQLAAATGDLPLLDLRPGGYTPPEVLAYLNALGEAGRELYLSRWFPADTVFLILLALFFYFSIRHLFQGAAAYARMLGRVLPLAYVAVDFVENRRVAQMIRDGADALYENEVLLASLMTRTKFFVFAVLVAILLTGLWRAFRARKSG
jgi:hypothetical protein